MFFPFVSSFLKKVGKNFWFCSENVLGEMWGRKGKGGVLLDKGTVSKCPGEVKKEAWEG